MQGRGNNRSHEWRVPVAQRIERRAPDSQVIGSSPIRDATISAPVAQWTERTPSKRKVVGSNPTGGATFNDNTPG